MPIDIATIGANAANSVIGQGMGLLLAKHNDKRQLKQQGKLQELEIKGQKEMGEFNRLQSMKMWEDTGYGAQMAQMKGAGLNPALMYGQGGGGGQTASVQSGNVSGGSAPTGGGEAQGMGMMMMQAQLLQAQKENIEADTKKKLQEVDNINIDTTKKGVETALITSTIENQDVQRKIMNLDRQLKALEVDFNASTFETRANQLVAELESAEAKGEVDRRTIEENVVILQKRAIQAGLENMNIEAETAKKIADVAQGWKDLDIKEKQLALAQTLGEAGLENKDQDQIIQVLQAAAGIGERVISKGKKK